MIRPASNTGKLPDSTQIAAPIRYIRFIRLNEQISPNNFVIFPASSDPAAIANVSAPERIPTCPSVSPSPDCHTVIVADSPMMIPDPSIDPIPAAPTSGIYFFVSADLLIINSFHSFLFHMFWFYYLF